MLLVLCRQELALLKMQREDDLTQIENDPEHIRKIKSQARELKINADAIALAIETARKIVGEPVTGIASEKDLAAIVETDIDAASISKEVDKLVKRREQLAKRIERAKRIEEAKNADLA